MSPYKLVPKPVMSLHKAFKAVGSVGRIGSGELTGNREKGIIE
jgi:hypothetical protein